MSHAGKIGGTSAVVGAAVLPQTGETMFSLLPFIGLALLSIIIIFSYYNYRLEKKLNSK